MYKDLDTFAKAFIMLAGSILAIKFGIVFASLICTYMLILPFPPKSSNADGQQPNVH